MERISQIQRVAFDKTGTLTCGRLEVAAVVSVNPAYTKDEIFWFAAQTEQHSEHPLGRAIIRSYLQNGNGALSAIADFKVIAGQGITAVLLSVLGILTPVTGAIWHNFGSVFVVVNAALLLGVKDDTAG